eukprot:881345-Rhodomonas_salina.1
MTTFAEPVFLSKLVSQSSPVAGRTNNLTITLKTNVDLDSEKNSKIILSGLQGAAILGSSVDVFGSKSLLFCNSSGTPGTAGWDPLAASLEFSVCDGQAIAPLIEYVVIVTIRNPTIPQSSPNMTIFATGAVSISNSFIQKPRTALFGIARGADPLTIVSPEFIVRNISQTNPIAGSQNDLVIILRTTIALRSGSFVEVSGLEGVDLISPVNIQDVHFCHPNLTTPGLSGWDMQASKLRMR